MMQNTDKRVEFGESQKSEDITLLILLHVKK